MKWGRKIGLCRLAIIAMMWLAFCTASRVHAAIVRVDVPSTEGGGYTIPLDIVPGRGEEVAGLQFDLLFDHRQYELADLQIGLSTSDASKELMFSELAPGHIKVIIAGLNQNTILDGTMARAVLTPADGVSGPPEIALESIVISDPVGNAVDVEYDGPSLGKSTPENDELTYAAKGSEMESIAVAGGHLKASRTDTAPESHPARAVMIVGVAGQSSVTTGGSSSAVMEPGRYGKQGVADPYEPMCSGTSKDAGSDSSRMPRHEVGRLSPQSGSFASSGELSRNLYADARWRSLPVAAERTPASTAVNEDRGRAGKTLSWGVCSTVIVGLIWLARAAALHRPW